MKKLKTDSPLVEKLSIKRLKLFGTYFSGLQGHGQTGYVSVLLKNPVLSFCFPAHYFKIGNSGMGIGLFQVYNQNRFKIQHML